jgi:UTP--glucose-1-phosphate uridylyltransferase
MLPLVDKPLIQYALEEAAASGIEDVVIITGRGEQSIEDHFDRAVELEHILEQRGKLDALAEIQQLNHLCQIAYVRQKEALGLGHAVATARPWVPAGEPTAVLLADDILVCDPPCLAQMIAAYEKVEAPIIAAMEVPEEHTHRYGIFQVEPDGEDENLLRLVDMVEKPPPGEAPSNLAAIGRYIITEEVFQALGDLRPGAGGEIQLTDAFRKVLKERPVYAYRFQGTRYDGGDKLGFLKATLAHALESEALRGPLVEHMRKLVDGT